MMELISLKRILFVNSSLSDGGSERVMCLIANSLCNIRGFTVDMVLLREKDDVYRLDKKINCEKYTYNRKNKLSKFLKRFFLLRKKIKNGNYDYIVSFMYDINILTLVASTFSNSKVIVSERNNPNSKDRSKIVRKIADILYLRAYKIVFQTEEVKEMFNCKIQSKSVVIPNPINENLPSIYEKERSKKIVAIGRLAPQKNFELLINSFAEVHKYEKKFKLIIYGEGPLKEKLNNQIRKLSLEDFVELPGYVNDVNEQIRDAYMYVSSSNYEGISNAMLESMALGIPSICTDCPVGGARMVIKSNINGILIPTNDQKELTDKILFLINNPSHAKKMSMEARKVVKEYSIEKITKMWLDIIKE